MRLNDRGARRKQIRYVKRIVTPQPHWKLIPPSEERELKPPGRKAPLEPGAETFRQESTASFRSEEWKICVFKEDAPSWKTGRFGLLDFGEGE